VAFQVIFVASDVNLWWSLLYRIVRIFGTARTGRFDHRLSTTGCEPELEYLCWVHSAFTLVFYQLSCIETYTVLLSAKYSMHVTWQIFVLAPTGKTFNWMSVARLKFSGFYEPGYRTYIKTGVEIPVFCQKVMICIWVHNFSKYDISQQHIVSTEQCKNCDAWIMWWHEVVLTVASGNAFISTQLCAASYEIQLHCLGLIWKPDTWVAGGYQGNK